MSVGGHPTSQSIALNLLLLENDIENILLFLLKHSNMAGKLYSLCGLYFHNYDLFKEKVKPFTMLDDSVQILWGSRSGKMPVSTIISNKKAIKLKQNQTLKDWYNQNYSGDQNLLEPAEIFEYDIVGGGWPHDFLRTKYIVTGDNPFEY